MRLVIAFEKPSGQGEISHPKRGDLHASKQCLWPEKSKRVSLNLSYVALYRDEAGRGISESDNFYTHRFNDITFEVHLNSIVQQTVISMQNPHLLSIVHQKEREEKLDTVFQAYTHRLGKKSVDYIGSGNIPKNGGLCELYMIKSMRRRFELLFSKWRKRHFGSDMIHGTMFFQFIASCKDLFCVLSGLHFFTLSCN